MFGSVLRDDFRPNSDVDVLVEFGPGYVPGYSFITVQDELSELLGRRVDLHTRASLSQHFRDAVVRDAEVHYAAAFPRVTRSDCGTCWKQPRRP
jgi:predicted nucleotidyltransferase